ncbi:branched-chain-amino-acid transaminase [Streptomyces sp. NPDC057539]|uniref:branched-chain-amino-acid transaminase n=1 Tax=unclassified Streptomyces TaxID=2593676 RepID=UPI00342F4AA8
MSELSQPEYIWFDGAVRPWADATVHVWSEAVLRAASVFEGMRGYWCAEESRHYILHAEAHVQRLRESARVVRIPNDLTVAGVLHGINEMISSLGYQEDIYIRPTLYLERGRYTNDANISDTGYFMPVFPVPRGESITTGQSVMVSSWRRSGDDTAPPRVKAAANYYNLRLARLEAEAAGADEAILLNAAGKVAETGGASVFLVRDGRVVTPAVSESILDSITRRSAIELLRETAAVEVEERPVDRTELYQADEVFLTGTLCEITPVVSVDRLAVGSGSPGDLTKTLQAEYYAACRAGAGDRRSWLTPAVKPVPSTR